MESIFALFWLFSVANVILVIWALVDAIRVPDDSMFQAGTKLIWVLVILFAGFVGAIVYLAVGRPPGEAARGPLRRVLLPHPCLALSASGAPFGPGRRGFV